MSKSVLSKAKKLIPQMNSNELKVLFRILDDMRNKTKIMPIEEVHDAKFSEGLQCPHCKEKLIIKFGKHNGVQRYRCKSCKKTFSDTTQTPFAYSKKNLSQWEDFIQCMVDKFSLRKSAKRVGISLDTSFFWRHKILDAINLHEKSYLSGIVEADETYFKESFKGNHSKSKTFTMPRVSRKNGKISVRGLSKLLVCVLCAQDRNGHLIIVPACKGRISTNKITSILDGHLSKTSTFCTDLHKSYMGFTANVGIKHVRVLPMKSKGMVYNIQHINAVHSNIKTFMAPFKGVATKYLSNYMNWYMLNSQIKDWSLKSQITYFLQKVSKYEFKTTTNTLRIRPSTV